MKVCKIVVVAVLLFVLMVPVVMAQEENALPSDLGELATPAGMGLLITAVLGLLKRLSSEKHGWIGGLGDWLNADPFNQFLTSIILALVVLGGLWAVDYFGVYDVAGEVWATFVVAWTVSQGLYNGQKAVVKKVAG